MTTAKDRVEGRPQTLDPETVRAFRDGDPRALGAVFDRYSGAVWTVAMRVLGDASLAEDATQEAFLKAWRSAATVDPDRDMGPWLLTIARRTAVDVWRRESRPTQGGHATEQDAPVVLPGIEGVWEAWEVRCAVDALPEDEREIVRLAHFGHMTQSEVAEALGLPVGTVKSRSHRAHKRLAGLLRHMLDGSDQPAERTPRTRGGRR